MDIRDLPGPLHQSLAAFNARHPWSHNEHFHGWILRNLPVRRHAAVDVGCGEGVLASKLATYFTHVTGIDRSAGMAAAASARLRGFPQVTIHHCDFADFSAVAPRRAGHNGHGRRHLLRLVSPHSAIASN